MEGLKVNNCEEGEVRIERDGIVNLLQGIQGYGGKIKNRRFCFTMLKTKLVFKIKETTFNRTEKLKGRFKDI